MVDSKDLAILEALKEDSRASIKKIGKKTGLPTTTVHNRIKKLKQDKVIRRYTVDVDHRKLGKEVSALISITMDYKALREKGQNTADLVNKISAFPFVEFLHTVTGTTDIMVKARVKNMSELNKFVMGELRNYNGIEKTTTMVIME